MLIPFKKTVSDVSVLRFIWLPVVVYPWLVAASYISKQTSDKTRKYSSKENFMRKLLKLPGEEEILVVGAAVSKGDRETALVMESATSNVFVEESVGGRLRRQVVDQEDIRRVLCRAATIGEFFRLLHLILSCWFWTALLSRRISFLF